jgi:hypothetical protein
MAPWLSHTAFVEEVIPSEEEAILFHLESQWEITTSGILT